MSKMKSTTTVWILVIVAVAGIAAGLFMGGAGGLSRPAVDVQTTTVTVTQTGQNLVNYWAQASASTPWANFMISRTALVPLLNAGNSSIFLLDVRKPTGNAGYTSGHIAGAVNIPFENMSAAVASGEIPKDKIIIAICYTGQEGAQTMAILRALGYNAYSLQSGMAGWNNSTRSSTSAPLAMGQNYPIVTGSAPGVWALFTPAQSQQPKAAP